MRKIIIFIVIVATIGLIVITDMSNTTYAENNSDNNSFPAVWKSIDDLQSQLNAVQANCAANNKPADQTVEKSKGNPVAISPQEDKTVSRSKDYIISNITIQ